MKSRLFFIISIVCFFACVFVKDPGDMTASLRYIIFGVAFLIMGFVIKAKFERDE